MLLLSNVLGVIGVILLVVAMGAAWVQWFIVIRREIKK